MKALLNYLKTAYPKEDKTKINHWVNVQYARTGEAFGQPVSLRDVNEYSVVEKVKDAVESLALSFDDLFSSIKVVCRLNTTASNFEPIIQVGHNIYEGIFARSGMTINALLFGFSNDEVVYTGSNKHIKYKQGAIDVGEEKPELSCIFINYTLTSGVLGSMIIDADEIKATKEGAIDRAMNGVNPFSEQEWLSICAALLFKRLVSDANLSAISNVFDIETLSFIGDIIALGEEAYTNVNKDGKKQDNVVYGYGGRVIARKIKRFNALDKKKHHSAKFNDNVIPVPVGKEPLADFVKSKECEKAVAQKVAQERVPAPASFEERSSPQGFGNF